MSTDLILAVIYSCRWWELVMRRWPWLQTRHCGLQRQTFIVIQWNPFLSI